MQQDLWAWSLVDCSFTARAHEAEVKITRPYFSPPFFSVIWIEEIWIVFPLNSAYCSWCFFFRTRGWRARRTKMKVLAEFERRAKDIRRHSWQWNGAWKWHVVYEQEWFWNVAEVMGSHGRAPPHSRLVAMGSGSKKDAQTNPLLCAKVEKKMNERRRSRLNLSRKTPGFFPRLYFKRSFLSLNIFPPSDGTTKHRTYQHRTYFSVTPIDTFSCIDLEILLFIQLTMTANKTCKRHSQEAQ